MQENQDDAKKIALSRPKNSMNQCNRRGLVSRSPVKFFRKLPQNAGNKFAT